MNLLFFSVIGALLLLCSFSIDPSESYEQRHQQRDSSAECFVTFLKQQSVNDEFFNTVKSLYSLTEACLRGVDFEKEQLFKQTKSNLRYDNNRDCLTERLGDETYKNLLLKMKSVKSIGEGVIKKLGNMWNGVKSPKQRAIERVERETNDFFASAETNCNLKIGFEEVFDSFFELEYEENNFAVYKIFASKKSWLITRSLIPSNTTSKCIPKT